MKDVMCRVVLGAMVLSVIAAGCDRFQPKPETTNPLVPPESTGATSITFSAPPVSEADTVARVNGAPASMNDYKQLVEEFKLLLTAQGVEWSPTPQDQEQLLEELVRTELMARDSVARGMNREPDVQARLWYLQRRLLADEWRRREQRALRVTPQDVETFYNANKAYYKMPAKLRVRQIAVPTQAEARTILRQLLDGADFATLARQSSKAPDASTGGNVGMVVRAFDKQLLSRPGAELEGAVLFPEAETVIFALESGGISQIVKGPGVGGMAEAYYLFQAASKEPERAKELSAVRDEIEAYLKLQKLNERIAELRNKADVKLYKERLGGAKP